MLSLWGCFTSNTRKARAFRAFPFIVLGLIGLEYLFSSKSDENQPTLDNSRDKKSGKYILYDEKKSICLSRSKRLMGNDKKPSNFYEFFETVTLKKFFCVMPTNLGPIKANKTKVSLEEVDSKYPEVLWGGFYTPPKCNTKYRVAIVIPYRDRRDELAIFLNNIHPFLKAQEMIEYAIFVIEQSDDSPFNRGKLLNIGFLESNEFRAGGWHCFIFHDVDLLPLNTKNMYNCVQWPKHMAVSIDTYSFRLKYKSTLGGAVALRREHFTKVNGYSNLFLGWGGEDIDMFHRLKLQNYGITRYHVNVARYSMLSHTKKALPEERLNLIKTKAKNYKKDGLNTINYKIISICQNHLYTHILVKTDLPPHDLPVSREDSYK